MIGFLFGADKHKNMRCDVCGAYSEDCREHALGFVYCSNCSDGKLVEGVYQEFRSSNIASVIKPPVLGRQRG